MIPVSYTHLDVYKRQGLSYQQGFSYLDVKGNDLSTIEKAVSYTHLLDVRMIYDDMGCLTLLPAGYYAGLEKYGIKCMAFNHVIPCLLYTSCKSSVCQPAVTERHVDRFHKPAQNTVNTERREQMINIISQYSTYPHISFPSDLRP